MVGPGPGETALHSTDAYMDSHSFGLKMVEPVRVPGETALHSTDSFMDSQRFWLEDG